MRSVVAHDSPGCRKAHRLCDSADVLVMCWTLATRIETDIVEQLCQLWILSRDVSRVMVLQPRESLSDWIKDRSHDAEERGADVRRDSQWLCVP